MVLVAKCWYRNALAERCRRHAEYGRGSHLYCAEHAALLDAEAPVGRTMRSNPYMLTDEEGGLDKAISEAVARLEAEAVGSLNSGSVSLSRLKASDPTSWVAARMDIRYRQELPENAKPHRWIAAPTPGEGRTARRIIDDALRGLAGIDDGSAFFIPGKVIPSTELAAHLDRLYRILEAGQRNKAIAQQVAEFIDAVPEAKAAMKEAARLHARLPTLVGQLDARKIGHRSPNTAPDAAAVLLAGCWWLAVGRWPSSSNDGKGRFYRWAHAVLKNLRPDLLRLPTQAAADDARGLGRSIKRQRTPILAGTGAGDVLGPWLAMRVLAESDEK